MSAKKKLHRVLFALSASLFSGSVNFIVTWLAGWSLLPEAAFEVAFASEIVERPRLKLLPQRPKRFGFNRKVQKRLSDKPEIDCRDATRAPLTDAAFLIVA